MESKSGAPSKASSPKKKKKKRKGVDSDYNDASGASTPVDETAASSGLDTLIAVSEKKVKKKKRKRRKKNKKKKLGVKRDMSDFVDTFEARTREYLRQGRGRSASHLTSSKVNLA